MPFTKNTTAKSDPGAEQPEGQEPAVNTPTDYEPIKTDDTFDESNIMEISTCGNITTIRTTFKHIPSVIDNFVKKDWAFLGVCESPLRHAILIFKSK